MRRRRPGLRPLQPLLPLLLAALAGQPAQAGLPEAMAAYEAGDHAAAAREARAPAEAGEPDAQLLLGDLYAAGRGVPQDFVFAHLWYNLAAASGREPGATARDELAKRMTPGQLAEAQRMARSWQPSVAPAAVASTTPTPATAPVDAAEVQRELARLGYDPGPADGQPGRRTRAAIKAFQSDAGLFVDGQLTPSLLVALRNGSPRPAQPQTTASSLPPVMATARPAALHTVPDSGAARVADLPEGARVMTGEVRGSWVRVRALAPASGAGWVDSYALAPDPSGQAVVQPGAGTAPAEQGGVGELFQGLARGVSSLFGGGSNTAAGSASGSTATIGIRGFDTAEFAAGRPNAAEFARLDDYAVSIEEAQRFATELGLQSARVVYLPEPAPAGGVAGVTPRGRDE